MANKDKTKKIYLLYLLIVLIVAAPFYLSVWTSCVEISAKWFFTGIILVLHSLANIMVGFSIYDR